MLGRARPEDCPELCKNRVELELLLLVAFNPKAG